MNSLLLVALVTLYVTFCSAHPTKVKLSPNSPPPSPTNPPPFRSFHVHVLFEKVRSSDTCTGYDDAVILYNRFLAAFPQTSPVGCQGLVELGDTLCMFEFDMTAAGPFLQPQWSVYVPVTYYAQVVMWFMQFRGPFNILIHPNSGYERYDHSVWALWGGTPAPLDMSLLSFADTLPFSLFNTTCRTEPALYTYPPKYQKLNPAYPHIRLVSVQTRGASTPVRVTVEGMLNTFFPIIANTDQTPYLDAPVFTPITSIVACVQNTTICVTSSIGPIRANDFLTIVYVNVPGVSISGGTLQILRDVVNVSQNDISVRVFNAYPQTLTVQDVVNNTKPALSLGSVPSLQSATFTVSNVASNQQNLFTFYQQNNNNGGKGESVVDTEPYFVYGGAAITMIVVAGLPSNVQPNVSVLLLFDNDDN